MPRLRSSAGAVVNVSDATAARLGAGWEQLGDTGYDAMTVDQLKDEIRSRNQDRDDDDRLSLTGTKADLAAELEADDRR